MSLVAQCISYPKSGRTWLRYMLDVLGINEALRFHHDGFEFNNGSKPPHDFDLKRRLSLYQTGTKIVYLDRDPRDVLISLHHQITGRFRDFFAYDGDISAFIRDDYFGAEVLADFRALWASILAERDYLHVSYEDLHEDTTATLRSVVEYLNLSATDQQISDAVERGRMENMRQLEQSGSFPEPWLRPRNGFPKVRKGEVGAYSQELSAKDIDYLNAVFRL